MVCGSHESTVRAIWAATGASLWSRTVAEHTPFVITLAYAHAAKALVTTIDDGSILVLDAFTGNTRWTMLVSMGDAPISPAVDTVSVILPVNSTQVTRMSLADGSVMARYGGGAYEKDVMVFDDAVVVQQSQAGAVSIKVHQKESGRLLETLPTPKGYFNKKLGYASGWLWAWSGASGAAPAMFQFY